MLCIKEEMQMGQGGMEELKELVPFHEMAVFSLVLCRGGLYIGIRKYGGWMGCLY